MGQLSDSLHSLAQYIPSDFSRKCRSAHEVLRWKATEFRLFLLYLGPLVLSNILPLPLYNHFMLLNVALTILIDPVFSKNCLEYAHNLLVLFVNEGKRLYGKGFLVYNAHCLIHFSKDVQMLGPLDNFSCFTFENLLGQLKKMIRKPQFPTQQIVRRLGERKLCRNLKNDVTNNLLNSLKGEHLNGPLFHGFEHAKQFKKVQ